MRLPFISVLTDPTTGGVTASFMMLGDINIAEPGALDRIRRAARDRADDPAETPRWISDLRISSNRARFSWMLWFTAKDLKTYISSALDFSPGLARMTYEESIRYLFTLGRELASPRQSQRHKIRSC